MSKIAVALVDDHRVVARSLKAYLESFSDLEVIGIAASGEEILEHLPEWKPRVVLQDLLMPGASTVSRRRAESAKTSPTTKVIALTASIDEARMMGVLRAGAAGYVRKDAEPEILLSAVRAVARGKTYIDPSVARQLVQASAPHSDLTTREVEVLRGLTEGLANKEIADRLSVSDETVKTHVSHILSKLQVENRAQAIVQAIKRGLVSLEEVG